MPKTIEWTKTGGKTHRVIFTTDEPISRMQWLMMNTTSPYLDAKNAYLSAVYQNQMQHAAMAAYPGSQFSNQTMGAVSIYQSGLAGTRSNGILDGLFGRLC